MYAAVPQDETTTVGKEDIFRPLTRSSWLSRQRTYISAMLSMLLLASLIANVFLIHRQLIRPFDAANELPSKFGTIPDLPSLSLKKVSLRGKVEALILNQALVAAHLRRNVPTEIIAHSNFDSLNRTVQDAAWNAPELEPWSNFVALDEDYTVEMGLPHSQRWPWDHSKGAYILTSAHELHCVVSYFLYRAPGRASRHGNTKQSLPQRILRVALNENYDGVPYLQQTWPYGHLIHCLNVLRESVMCNADDTPLYTGHLHANAYSSDPKAGIGTIKMCRDWSALLDWSRERSACYRPVHWHEDYPEIERYKFCPDGSRPWEQSE